ncbi:SCAN domain-containing protein 3-like [Cottoperca gobio]|uniref:SCAN domain-containing protein 3-like n=1 Tax=Cottoperca gobio TaxID=56716 RepID=A0A6J2RT72_COTGO|nr:SCAN domain-containing protein 3-like [Cottoperca gobio]
MTAEDDPEAFLDIFVGTAEACGWPQAEWGIRLLPLLSGEAQRAAHTLPATSRYDYNQLRRAILDRFGSTVRSLPFEDAGRPFAFAQQLLDSARRWLQPGVNSVEDIVGQVALEQFIAGLPPSSANWIQCHRPASLEAAVRLAEDHLSLPRRSLGAEARAISPPQLRPVPAPRRFRPAVGAAGPGTTPYVMEVGQLVRIVAPPDSSPVRKGCTVYRYVYRGVFTKLCGTRDVRRPWSTSAWFGPGRCWRRRG